MDAIIFPGRLRPGKRIASIGRRQKLGFCRLNFVVLFTFSRALVPGAMCEVKKGDQSKINYLKYNFFIIFKYAFQIIFTLKLRN